MAADPDDTVNAPSALPTPKNARMKPNVCAPSSSVCFAMNGSSTSIGPSTTSTNMLANNSVHNNHGVRSMNTKPSRRSRSRCGRS